MSLPCQKAAEIAAMQTSIKHVLYWQNDQESSILRVEQKLDRLIFWIMGMASLTVINLVTNFW